MRSRIYNISEKYWMATLCFALGCTFILICIQWMCFTKVCGLDVCVFYSTSIIRIIYVYFSRVKFFHASPVGSAIWCWKRAALLFAFLPCTSFLEFEPSVFCEIQGGMKTTTTTTSRDENGAQRPAPLKEKPRDPHDRRLVNAPMVTLHRFGSANMWCEWCVVFMNEQVGL